MYYTIIIIGTYYQAILIHNNYLMLVAESCYRYRRI